MKFYNTIVVPMAQYRSNTYIGTLKKDTRKIKSHEIKSRSNKGCMLTVMISTANIRQELKTFSLETKITD